jgi:hypothetical protein
MLLNYVINFLYMRVLKIIFGKYFFAIFLIFFSLLCEASRRWFCMSGRWGRFVRTFLIQVWTCALVRYLTWHYVQTALVIRLDGEPLRVKSHSPYAARHFSPSLWIFLSVCAILFGFSHASLTCSCPFVISLHPRYDSFPFYWFFLSFYA